METWKTRMRLAFPTFPQGLPRETKNGHQVQVNTVKEGGLSTAVMTKTETFTPQFLVGATPQF